MKRIIIVFGAMLTCVYGTFAAPDVTDVVARQRYPWNGLVDITCKVTGIDAANDNIFVVAAVMPDSGEVRKVSHFWVVQNGTNSTDQTVSTNGNYRLLWDASADLGQVVYDNMVMRVTIRTRNKVQLWANGPYWAECNVGASRPEDFGYYFWWGDTIGYRRVNDAWVASDGSSSNFSFRSSPTCAYDKTPATLHSEGWVVWQNGTYVLTPAHDAAHVQWGGDWRMPTQQELDDLDSNCDWTWTTRNGVNGYEVRGRGGYASNSIFLPCAGDGIWTSLDGAGSYGYYWSSVPSSSFDNSWDLYFKSGSHGTSGDGRRDIGRSVRPVQGFTGPYTYTITLDRQSGSGGTTSVTATYGSAMPSITVPTRIGYTFGGYYTRTSGSGTQYYTSSGTSARVWDKTSATTLYAKWTPDGVQLWANGPYWAECNVGASRPEEFGYYFWWGDTIGYRRVNDAWVARDGSSSNFSFSVKNTPTWNKREATLHSERWVVLQNGTYGSTYVLTPAHDAAHVQWGGDWRMPTQRELEKLDSYCDWTWTTRNGVNGYEVRGHGDYASNSIFLPCAGYGSETSLYSAGSSGQFWSSVPGGDCYSWGLESATGGHRMQSGDGRYLGLSVRPVQGFTE